MPPSFSLLLFFLLLTLSTNTTSSPNPCTSGPTPCPPFSATPPPYPFSSIPGCGHPSFQINCSAPHSTLSINNLIFSLLQFQPNSSTLLLSPLPNNRHHNCSSSSFPSLPARSINLTASPFRLSNPYCSHLASLTSCPLPPSPSSRPPPPRNCSRCAFHCSLLENPLRILSNGCDSSNRRNDLSPGACQDDVLGYLDRFLTNGFEVEYDLSSDSYFTSCEQCRSRSGSCGFNDSDPGKSFLCFGSSRERTRTSGLGPPWAHRDSHHRIALFSAVVVSLFTVFAVSVLAAVYRCSRLKSLTRDETASFLHLNRSPNQFLPPVFTYEELERSTDRFDLKRRIGNGGFGSVYLGRLGDGGVVAVKYLHCNGTKVAAAFSTKSFCNEILILSSLTHPNLVKLHGYCSDPRGLLLVYDYVPNGTLADHLHHNKGSSPMTWQTRLDVAVQTALALDYLHSSVSPPVVHRDVTSSNIFVERDMRVKLGDFGLSRLLVCGGNGTGTTSSSSASECVFTGPQGTPGYLDPDYHRSFRLTEKSDVYSFGVVLLELVSGLRAVDHRARDKREVALADLAVSKIQMGMLHQLLDPGLLTAGGVPEDGVCAVAELAFRCVAADKDDRPDSREVAEELGRIRIRTGTPRSG